MVQEACQQVDVLGAHFVADNTNNTTSVLQDLKEYFRRPAVIYNAAVTPDVVNNVYAISIDSTTLPTIFAGFSTRLTGVAGLSFDIVFTLQVSTTPFSQGVLAMCWQYGQQGNFCYDRTIVPAMCTNLPHVRLDIAESTMVQLRIPFLNAMQFLDTRSTGFHGTMGVNAILPVKVGVAGNTVPTVRILCHLENLKFFHAAPLTATAINFQAGGSSPIEEEFEKEAYPFSSAAHAASKTLKWIAKGVPSLSSIAGPTSWFLGKAAGLIRYFGYAKPLVQSPVMRMWDNATIMEHNADVPSSALMIGPMATNHLRIDSNVACTDVDEMSLEYVLTQWGQIARFAFNTTDTVNSNLWGILNSPSNMWFKGSISGSSLNRAPFASAAPATEDSFIPSHLFWWGQCFKQWRGDIEYRFTFSKTKMHAGRVLLAYNPIGGAQQNGCGPAISGSVRSAAVVDTPVPFAYSTVFDLKDTNVFTFRVPYYSAIGYTDFCQHTGTLIMKVFDTLKASGVTATTIHCMVEARACPGFELAIPNTPYYVPSTRGAHPIYQSGVVQVISSDVSEHAVGEHITSIKQLISLPTLIKLETNVFNASTINSNSADVETVMPWWVAGDLGSTALPNTYNYANLNPRHLNWGVYAARAYGYARGSTDIHVNSLGNERLHFMGAQLPPAYPACATWQRFSSNVVAWLTGYAAHFRFPGYSYAPRCSITRTNQPTTGIVLTQYTPVDNNDSQYMCAVKIMNANSTGNWYRLRMAAGDDAILGHYMGPVPLRYAVNDASIGDPTTSNMLLSGAVTPVPTIVAPPVEIAAVEKLPAISENAASDNQVWGLGAIQTTEVQPFVSGDSQPTVSRTLNVNKVVSPFEPTPPIPITSGDTGVFPSARAGGLTRSLPRAGRVNVEEVKSILDSLAES